jgi:hypothetical protein
MRFDPVELALGSPDASTFELEVLRELERTIGFDAAFYAVKGEPSTTST